MSQLTSSPRYPAIEEAFSLGFPWLCRLARREAAIATGVLAAMPLRRLRRVPHPWLLVGIGSALIAAVLTIEDVLWKLLQDATMLVLTLGAAGAGLRTGYLWYGPLLVLTWLLGAAVARWFSVPVERRLRAAWQTGDTPRIDPSQSSAV